MTLRYEGVGLLGKELHLMKKVGGTDRREVQTGVEIGGTDVVGSKTAGAGVASEDKCVAEKEHSSKLVKEVGGSGTVWIGVV